MAKSERVKAAKPSACASCPWLNANWGRTDTPKAEYYTPERRGQMWDTHPQRGANIGVRFGSDMACHLTAPPEIGGTNTQQLIYLCTGSVILKHRELLSYHDHGHPSSPDGLTLAGLKQVIRDVFGQDVPLHTVRSMNRDRLLTYLHPGVDCEGIGR